MKALHLLNTFRPGGAENVALNYSKILTTLNIKCCFVAKSDHIGYEKFISDSGYSVTDRLSYSLIFESKYIFVHSNYQLVRLLKYLPILRAKKIKVFYIQHLFYNEYKFKLLSKLINLVATDFIQITPKIDFLVSKYIDVNCIKLTNYYIPKYDITEHNSINSIVRDELLIPSEKIIVLYCSVFRNGKGLEDFLLIAEKFHDNNNYIFLILGDGPESYLINEYKYSNIKWLGFKNDVERYLISCDYFLFMSKFEMMPMALIEAIVTRTNIMCYDTDFTQSLVDIRYNNINDFINGLKGHMSNSYAKSFDFEYAKQIFIEQII